MRLRAVIIAAAVALSGVSYGMVVAGGGHLASAPTNSTYYHGASPDTYYHG